MLNLKPNRVIKLTLKVSGKHPNTAIIIPNFSIRSQAIFFREKKMMKKILIVVLLAVVGTLSFFGSVFAESETPPDPPVVEPEAQTTAQEIVEEPTIPAVNDAAIEVAFSMETNDLIGDVAETSDSVLEPAAIEEVILSNAEGEALDLVSQESAQLIVAGDPYWMVGTQKYATVFPGDLCPAGTTLGITCWQSATPINAALARIESSALLVPTDKKLYIVGGTTYVENIWIDGSSVFDLNKSKLVGLIGMPDTLGAYPVLDGYILLEMMKYGFTVSNITIINGYLEISGSQGTVVLDGVTVTNPAGTGITVGDSGVFRHKGNVTLKNVKSNNNSGRGADIYATGATTITNSTFSFNSLQGLRLNTTGGAVTINGIVARSNSLSILYIEKFEKSLSVSNAILHDSAGGNGLYALSTSKAPATLRSIYASRNDQYGIYLKTSGEIVLGNLQITDSVNKSGVYVDQTEAVSKISVTNSNFVSNATSDVGDGLEIKSLGTVTLTSINASNNARHGVNIDNCQYDGVLAKCKGIGTITFTSPADGSFQTANYFSGNWNSGIFLVSNNSVTLTNVQSNSNVEYGLTLTNYSATATLATNTNLSYWSNQFNGNGLDGIFVTGPGHISLKNTDASYNSGNGFASTSNLKNISVTNGEFNYNDLTGMSILSSGNVTLTNVNASGNDWWGLPDDHYGVYIDNSTGIGNVAVKTSASYLTNTIDNNDVAGLFINTKGLIVVGNTQANNNNEYGIYLNNFSAPLARSITVSNTIANNNFDGIYAISKGAIAFSNITANDNTDDGVTIDGCPGGVCTSVVSFNLGGSRNTFNNNGNDGLGVYTKGAISLKNVSAAGNYYGVWLDNDYSGVSNDVTISYSGTYRNTIEQNNYGLWIFTRGNINLTWVLANENNYGAYLDNSSAPAAKNLTLTNCDFNSNESSGLYTNIRGNIFAYSLVASYNSTHNGSIDPVDGAIITERLTADNGYDIWNIFNADGNYTVTLSTTRFDPAFEIWNADTDTLMYFVDDNGMTDPESVAFVLGASTNIYIKVFGYGMGGEYTLDVNGGPVVSMPEYYGAFLKNIGGNVTVTSGGRGISRFEENNYHGLFIDSTGVVNVNNLKAERNGGHGVNILNQQNVFVKGTHKTRSTSFSFNEGDGLHVESLGNISVGSAVEAFGNGTYGIYLDNTAATIAKLVYANRTKTYWNSTDGLFIISKGAITLENLESYQNGANGVYADNTFGTSGIVTVRGTNRFNGNQTGLFITTLKSADVSGVRAESNWGNGIYIESLSGTTKASNLTTRYNGLAGIYIQATNAVSINNIRAIHNGDNTFYEAGAHIIISGSGNLTIANSVFQANYGSGIEADLDAGKLTLSNTAYFGNDFDGTGLYDDLHVY